MFETNHKRKGLIGTILIHAILIVVFIFFGMTYQDPPPEQGVAIVFGFDDQGSGGFKPVPKVDATLEPQKEIEKVVQPPVEEVVPDASEEVKEEMMTQDSEESPISAEEKKKKKEADKKKLEEQKKEKERLEKERIANEKLQKEKEEREKKKAIQDAKKKKLDGMFAGLKSSEDATGTDANQGDDGVAGYKGDEGGIKGAKSFTGNGGIGDYGNYQLGNRKPKTKPMPKYEGSEEGIVVVRILVDNAGKVVYAEAGVKGSTTTDLQLLKSAKEAAMKTLWQSDESVKGNQEGRIIYNFIIEN